MISRRVNSYLEDLLNRRPSTGVSHPELDGLRGFAVFLVIASHTNLWHLRGAGAVGVWLFFVLSSFLLTKIMLAKVPGALSVRELARYLIRRIARILPVYYFVLLILALERGPPLEWVFRHAVFMQADDHFWSIPQEEVFYLLLPLLVAAVFAAQRWLRLPAVITAGLLLIGSLLGPPLFALPGNGTWIPFYLQIFLVGFCLAHVRATDAVKRVCQSGWFLRLANPLSILCLGSLFSAGAKVHLEFFRRYVPVRGDYLGWEHPVFFALVGAFLILTSLTPGSWTQRIFAWKGLRIIGVLSFALYLVHHRILTLLAGHLGVTEGLPLFVATFLISLTLALWLERYIERPSIEHGRSLNARIGSGGGGIPQMNRSRNPGPEDRPAGGPPA